MQIKIIKIRNNKIYHKHHYPYLQRWYDDFSESGKMIERHAYCFKCKKEFIIRFNPNSMPIKDMEFGLVKGRETIAKLKKDFYKTIKEYDKYIKKVKHGN
ncbi:MAG: hypothetical protein Q8L27_03325 [archaeon]|nr:hypothetical protein [archaeon]